MNCARWNSVLVSLTLAIAGCGGGGGSGGGNQPSPPPPPPPPVTITQAEAFQFLNQATFGATEAEAQRVIQMGFEGWIDDQLRKPASLHLPHLQALLRPGLLFELQEDRIDIWFRHALNADDQLRQRVAFALSEVMVVSQNGALIDFPYALADYYDVLVENAFGNYRDLIEAITLHPAMGIYLSMLGNEKPDPVNNIRPDENYARELMQLFSIGLVELNNDGTPVLGPLSQPVPTYDQATIEGFAHVFTGWTWAFVGNFHQQWPPDQSQWTPMTPWREKHDTGPKTLLNGVQVAGGQTAEQDLDDALDNIFAHANVGPFIAIRLIQRLTASNPSPAYVARVAAVFDNNGAGVRGDLGAVVKAILTDPEARPDSSTNAEGKIKEPLLRLTQLWRTYNAQADSGGYPIGYIWVFFGQGPLQANHVFNFFSPFYAPPGEIREAGLVAPELEIATEYLNTFSSNFMFWQIFYWYWNVDRSLEDITEDTILIDYSEETGLAGDVGLLIDRVDAKLLAGQMSAMLRQNIETVITQIPATEGRLRAAEAIYLVVTSPEFVYQR